MPNPPRPGSKGAGMLLAATEAATALNSLFPAESVGFPPQLWLAAACFLLPVAGFFLQWIFGKHLPRKGDWLPTGAMGLAFVSAAIIGVLHLSQYDPNYAIEWRFDWFEIAGSGLENAFAVGIYVDNTTVITLLMVTLLSFLIHLFSIGYMKGEVRYARFFATLNLFTAGMIGLVISNNFITLFASWEIMGLCSYLLIGHYFEKPSAQKAAIKAFLMTRIGDVFMFVGMMLVFLHTQTFLFTGPTEAQAATWVVDGASSYGLTSYAGPGSLFAGLGVKAALIGGGVLSALGLLLFVGPVGKSAQFPLHTWLPDAMEGPTPVSAMIHAACMVSAGVYLTARLFPLFTPDTLTVIAYVGGFTALFAGTIGLVQTDIKKVLAFSTISQLGYMFLGIGCGAWVPAVFHLITHAFFKALMFLGSGSVILGCHHEQEMTKMGGLWRKMPVTAVTFWVGLLAITGAPFFFSGFYSKEAILTGARIFGGDTAHLLPYIFGALGAGLTTLYMFRLIWMTFHGKPRDEHVFDHAKESPATVLIPLVSIAFFAVFIGWPIGGHGSASENLSITHVSEFGPHGETSREYRNGEAAGLRQVTGAGRPDADGRSWFSYLINKPRSAFSRGFLLDNAGYDESKTESVYRGHDGHGLYADSPGILAANGEAHAEHAAHDPVTEKWHERHHDAHMQVFGGSMLAFLVGLGMSVFFFSPWGPFYRKDWIGHVGYRHWLRQTLFSGYYLDRLYYGTVVRAQGWIMRGLSWFDKVVVDGLVNLTGWITVKMGFGAAKADYWGVDGTVRGIHNATGAAGRISQKAPTGKINDYIFMLIAAVVLLYIAIMLL